MPRREARFSVSAPPADLWRFIRDFESLCTCIPGVEGLTRVDDRTARFTVEEKVGVVPLRVALTAHIDTEDPPRGLHAVARAEHLDIDIDVRLAPAESGTELTTRFEVAGRGPLKPVVDRLFERRATERAAQFADCLARHFGSEPPAAKAGGARAPWWRRLWRRIAYSIPSSR